MTKHTMMVRDRVAMTFHTETNEPLFYRSLGRQHYVTRGTQIVAKFVEPEGWAE